MTGYGQAEADWSMRPGHRVVVEIRAVNAKHLELKVKQPFGPSAEREIRRHVDARLGRGRVECSVRIVRSAANADDGSPDQACPAVLDRALEQLLGIEQGAEARGLTLRPASSVEVARYLDVVRAQTSEAESGAPEFLGALVDRALVEVESMRVREGAALEGALAEIFDELEGVVDQIRAACAGDGARALELIVERLRQLSASSEVVDDIDPDRLAREAALVAARGDVAEEFARIASHLTQARQLLAAAAHTGQGKTLDFLSQELMREVGTIGSKVRDHGASSLVIAGKTCVDRIREQAQNVE